MSAQINFNLATYIDPGLVSVVGYRQDSTGAQRPIHHSANFGPELGSLDVAVPRIAAHLMDRARKDGGEDKYSPMQARKDAEDFATSTLTQIMSPNENVRRGEEKPYLFVPSRGPVLIPSRQTLDIGATAGQYQVRMPTGQAQWTTLEDGPSLQNAGSVGDSMNYTAHWYGIAYRWSEPETWSQKFTRVDYQQEREAAAVLALDDFQEQVSSWGDSTKSVTGAFTMGNSPLILGGLAFSTGVAAADQVLAFSSWVAMFSRANGKRVPSGAIVPTSDMIAMKNTYFTGTGITAWDQIIKNHPWMSNAVEADNLMLGNAAGTGPRWVFMARDPMKMHLEHTDTMVFGPFVKDLTTYFYLIRRHGGLIAKMPEMLFYVDFTLV